MSREPAVPRLADKLNITLAIRMLVDEQGQVQQGVVVDLCGNQVGQFRQLADLARVITNWLDSCTREQAVDEV